MMKTKNLIKNIFFISVMRFQTKADRKINMYEKYRDMLRRLRAIKIKNNGRESQEEDALLDEMDAVWLQLSPEEQRQLTEE